MSLRFRFSPHNAIMLQASDRATSLAVPRAFSGDATLASAMLKAPEGCRALLFDCMSSTQEPQETLALRALHWHCINGMCYITLSDYVRFPE